MASKKDMRRPDLVIPFQEPPPKTDAAEFTSTINSTLPMAALMMRNKYIGWTSVFFSVQNWLGQGEDAKKTATTPAYFSVLMSIVSLFVTYLPLFLPPPAARLKAGTSTEAPPPVPPA